MRLVLLGGAPGIGKTAAAENLLVDIAARGNTLVQWIDVDSLWRHQPWRVDDATITLLQKNLSAVLNNAASAGMDIALVTWVFQDPSFHDLVVRLAPGGVDVTTVQLCAQEHVWRNRFESDHYRPPIDEFFSARYFAAQRTPTDHSIETTTLDPAAVASEIARAIRLDP